MLHDNGKQMLIEKIKEHIRYISDDKNAIIEIKEQLENNGITGGRIESIMNNVDLLTDADNREVMLLSEQFYVKSSIQALNPTEWFTEHEIKNARQYDKRLMMEDMSNDDVIFDNVIIVGNGLYSTIIKPSMISYLFETQVLGYDEDIQRQAKLEKREDSIIRKPTVYKKNVKEIKNLLLKNSLKPTTLAFNATVGSSDDGEELYYDSDRRELTVKKGVILNVLDGYHRCLASAQAHVMNPELDFNFMLMISNWTMSEARQLQAQLAKATPFPKSRVEEFEANLLADTVVQHLKINSELKDRIASTGRPSNSSGELVNYSILTKAIDREFPMKFRRDTKEVAEYLTDFFDCLIAEYEDEFLNSKNKEDSLMNYNKMFVGYVALAARMKKENIEIEEMRFILDSIDFSRSNPLWKELGVLNSGGIIGSKLDEKEIANYFKKLDIKK